MINLSKILSGIKKAVIIPQEKSDLELTGLYAASMGDPEDSSQIITRYLASNPARNYKE